MRRGPRRFPSTAVLPLCALLLAVPLLLSASPARAAGVEREIHVPAGWEGAYEFGYAPVIRVGDQVIVSGIPAGGEGTYEEKVRRMYERAVDLLTAAGATIDDVVELTTFHPEPRDSAAFHAEFEKYMPIHRDVFGDHRPAWTAVGTTALLSPSAVVEMRVVAVIGSGKSSRVVFEKPPAGEVEKAKDESPSDASVDP
ncbi:MAG TPA: Rid family hydrolase [Thermoanaerobaculia bacterium]|nr:Rid family hydrolase [Thermoanaerobaculia bacterium]